MPANVSGSRRCTTQAQHNTSAIYVCSNATTLGETSSSGQFTILGVVLSVVFLQVYRHERAPTSDANNIFLMLNSHVDVREAF